jgi:hypothetical protein
MYRLCPNGLKFFWQACTPQIMAPHKILGFPDHFIYYYIFLMLNGTEEAQLHLEHTRILNPPRQKFGP